MELSLIQVRRATIQSHFMSFSAQDNETVRKKWTTKQCGHKRSYVWWLPMHKDDYGVWLIFNKNQHPKVSSLATWTGWKIRGKLGVWAVRSKRENSFMLLPDLHMFVKFRGGRMSWEYDINAKIFKENNEGLCVGLKMLAIGFECPCVQAVNGNSTHRTSGWHLSSTA